MLNIAVGYSRIGESKPFIFRLSEHSIKKCKDQLKKGSFSHFIKMSISRVRKKKR